VRRHRLDRCKLSNIAPLTCASNAYSAGDRALKSTVPAADGVGRKPEDSDILPEGVPLVLMTTA